MKRKLTTSLSRFVLIMSLISSAAAFGESDKADNASQGQFSSCGDQPDGRWTHTQKFTHLHKYPVRPDEKAVQTISVEWEDPAMDPFGNICTIRGQLKLPSSETIPARPVNWLQGITLYMAKRPDAKPDWTTQGFDTEDTFGCPEVVSRNGEFSFCIDKRFQEIQRDCKVQQSFQIGLALARIDGRTMTWDSQTPAIPSSVRMLTIPAAPKLSHELDLLNKAGGWPYHHTNTVDLIRAVNALHQLGKENAIATLEKYVEMSDEDGFRQQTVFWIVRLLFVPINPDDRIRIPIGSVHLLSEDSPDAVHWPFEPMAVPADVPFMLGHPISVDGSAELPSARVKWAREHGKLRAAPLRPLMQPLLAADTLLDSPPYKRLSEFKRKQATLFVRQQAQAMIENIMPSDETKPWLSDDQEWEKHVKKSVALGIHWDDERQDFVIEGK